jgi:3,4-dihydroxy 2-butanone 4-phosphate synthase/GTP cyclohydrolase II
MKLAEYLESNGIKRSEFASRIGVSGGRVTQLCEDGGWPSREVAERITAETGGAVTADDFLVLDGEPVEARA